ncbi:uncharacterized protein BKCO1_4900073 [Diplodia corticola]|uniref:Uncharacterized protein n=1 Tax=Diplodia corticola TaxID=236234 RepID=A0A1J9RFR8_9PEZI|nr:uncharacterized protein BKCO1_4900073 [Diplodia corticola]OJD31387.1 hypothetical protein BKCO1_4900073 [Diplodia corticola]
MSPKANMYGMLGKDSHPSNESQSNIDGVQSISSMASSDDSEKTRSVTPTREEQLSADLDALRIATNLLKEALENLQKVRAQEKEAQTKVLIDITNHYGSIKMNIDTVGQDVNLRQDVKFSSTRGFNSNQIGEYNNWARWQNHNITKETRHYMTLTPLVSVHTGWLIKDFPHTPEDFSNLNRTSLIRLIHEVRTHAPYQDLDHISKMRETFRIAIGQPQI